MGEHERKHTAHRGLDEFESASHIGLAPFEEESRILLDSFEQASPDLLDEFEQAWKAGYEEDRLSVDSDNGRDAEEGHELLEHEWEEIGETSEHGEESEEEKEVPVEVGAEPLPEELGAEPQPGNPVVGFVCRHSVNLGEIVDNRSRMAGRPIVHFIDFPCAGMVKPEWVKRVLHKGGSGAFVVCCAPGSCHHRTGACRAWARWQGLREPKLADDVDRSRVRFFFSHPLEREKLLRSIEKFLSELAHLDHQPGAGEETYAAGEPELIETDPDS